MNDKTLNQYLDFAQKLSYNAGQMMLDGKKSVRVKVRKGQLHDFATNIDLRVERLIISAIKKEYKDHGILSEEAGELKSNSPFRWIIDPLDGTWNYSVGIPLYANIIGLEYQSETVMAVFYLPQTQEFFKAVKGKGVYLNDKKIHVNNTSDLKASFVFSNYPSFKTPDDKLLRKLALSQKLIQETYRFYPSHSSSMDLLRIAQGAFEGSVVIDTSGKWWDLAAGIFFVKEAGGMVTTLDNIETTYNNYKRGFVASNGKIHKKLLTIAASVY